MEVIASTAGVAVGTLYRHFPTKTDLVGAVLAGYVEQITVEAESALDRAKGRWFAVDGHHCLSVRWSEFLRLTRVRNLPLLLSVLPRASMRPVWRGLCPS
ncbi:MULTISPECIES: TetR/AcrR family transcriptional regulator [Terrabacteria group]|uniref:TetR/AcrR family transcriptional regulator n=1 Tax=Bacillati TaxID=1783272 RepID=UPI0036323092